MHRLLSKIFIDGMKRRFPVGTILKVKEYTLIDLKSVLTDIEIITHYTYCIHMTEVMKNGVVWVEKGKHTYYSPSYVNLYFLLKNGVKVKE